MHRVKVYKLSAEGQWEDKGTGHISVEYMEQARAMGLVVISEDENGKTLLVHQISREDIYSHSGEATIITWHDTEIATDVAISFQEQIGCDHIWQQIKEVQREEHRRHDHEHGRKSAVDEYDQQGPSGPHMANGDFMDSDTELPAPERRNLGDIAKALSHVPPFQRDRVAAQLMRQNYLPALLDLFKQCEDLEDAEGLAHMYVIVRSAIMLNDSSVLEEMLREEHVMDVLGALEYDPDVKQPQKHRDFLQSHVQFKEVVPITNPQVLAKIHQTYRIQYLKDVILPRSLDDATYATLSSLALFNNMEVVSALMADPAFLPELFSRLQGTDPADASWHDLVAFLQEFCSLARHLQQQQRASLFNRLIQLGLFEVVTRIMLHSADDVKLRATDILMSSMQHDVLALREFLRKQEGHTLFGLLVHELAEGRDTGLAEQVCETMKLLMDPETMEQPVEKNEFLEMFYDHHLDKLADVILSDSSINASGTRVVPAATLGLILELLNFCVQNHSYRIKYYTLRKHLVEKVLRLLHRRERWLVCATVRFMRVCVALREDFFTRYLLRNNCFGPVMGVFFENGERYNLLNSAVLDLIEYIRRENIKPILEHLVETYGHRFDEMSYVETFKMLRLKYEQAMERAGSAGNGPGGGSEGGGRGGGDEEMADAAGPSGAGGGGGGAAHIRGRTFSFPAGGGGGVSHHTRAAAAQAHGRRRRRDDRDLDKDEEDYFSEDADDEQEDAHTRPSHLHSHSHPHGPMHAAADGPGLGQGGLVYGRGGGGGGDLGRRRQCGPGGYGGGGGAEAEERGGGARGGGGGAGGSMGLAREVTAAPELDLAPHGAGGAAAAATGPPAGGTPHEGSQAQQQPGSGSGSGGSAAQGGAPQAAAAGPSQDAPRQWPGLVDYDDDDDTAGPPHQHHQDAAGEPQGQPPAAATAEVAPAEHRAAAGAAEALPPEGNGPVAAVAGDAGAGGSNGGGPEARGRSPGPDLGRRPRSEDDGGADGSAAAAKVAGAGATELGGDMRKRLRSDDA